MRRIQEPFTIRKHGELQSQINDLMIAIKLHHTNPPEENTGAWAMAKARVSCPTWDNVLEILDKSFRALDQQRENPIKY